jgi:hypothetical protein
VVALVLAGCQPGPTWGPDGASACGLRPEGPTARPIRCPEDVPGQGEGQRGDAWLASPWLRAVVRHPQGALSVAGASGGTVVDVSPWGFRDRFHEIVPLVDGGWLDVTDWHLDADGVVLTGTVAGLPGLPPVDEGAPAEIRWSLAPDGPWLLAEGATGFLVHPRGRRRLEDGRLVVDGVTIAAEGSFVDLGGAVRIDGADRLLVAASDEALARTHPGGRRVRLEDLDADALRLWGAEGAVVAEVRVLDGAVDLRLPPGVDRLQAVREGHALRPPVPVDRAAELGVGPEGGILVVPAWTGRGHPLAVRWTGSAGAGTLLLPAGGGTVPTGPGPAVLEVEEAGGPVAVEAPAGDVADLFLDVVGDPSPRLPIAWQGPADRSWDFGGTDADAVLQAGARGLGFVVLAPALDVAGAPDRLPEGTPAWRRGTRVVAADGTPLVVWPLGAPPSRTGHGAPIVDALPLGDALAAAGADRRTVVVPVEGLDGLGPPRSVLPPPTLVALSDPGPEGPGSGAWGAWFDWLDAGRVLPPVGPVTRVAVPDLALPAAVDVDAALQRGRTSAGSGPDLWLEVGGAIPGDVAPRRRNGLALSAHTVRPSVADPGDADRVGVVVDGVVVHAWPPDAVPAAVTVPLHATWVALAAWSTDPSLEAWAITGPVWLDAPRVGPTPPE